MEPSKAEQTEKLLEVLDTSIKDIEKFKKVILSHIFSPVQGVEELLAFIVDFQNILRKEGMCMFEYAVQEFGWKDIYDVDYMGARIKKSFDKFKPEMYKFIDIKTDYFYKHHVVVKLSDNSCFLLLIIGKKLKDALGFGDQLRGGLLETKVKCNDVTRKLESEMKALIEKCDGQIVTESKKLDSFIVETTTNIARLIEADSEQTKKLGETDAKLEKEIAEVDTKLLGKVNETDAKLEKEITEVDTKLLGKVNETDAKLGKGITELDAKLTTKIDNIRTELIEQISKSEKNMDAKLIENVNKLGETIDGLSKTIHIISEVIQQMKIETESKNTGFSTQIDSLFKKLNGLEFNVEDLLSINGKDIVFMKK